MKDQEIVLRLSSFLYEKKARDIVVLNVSHLTVLCDWLVILSGRTAAQVSSLADYAENFMDEKKVALRRSEGQREGRWIVLDYGSVMIHLFHQDERSFYGLDHLWNDGSNALDLPFDQTVPD